MPVTVLVIGQAPGKNHKCNRALDGPGSGDRLASLFGISREQLMKITTTINLLEEFPGKSGKGDSFPLLKARRKAKAIKYRFWAHNRVLLLGRAVAVSFDLDHIDYMEWMQLPGFVKVAVLPHPSGINRWYNDPENTRKAQKFCREILNDFITKIALHSVKGRVALGLEEIPQ